MLVYTYWKTDWFLSLSYFISTLHYILIAILVVPIPLLLDAHISTSRLPPTMRINSMPLLLAMAATSTTFFCNYCIYCVTAAIAIDVKLTFLLLPSLLLPPSATCSSTVIIIDNIPSHFWIQHVMNVLVEELKELTLDLIDFIPIIAGFQQAFLLHFNYSCFNLFCLASFQYSCWKLNSSIVRRKIILVGSIKIPIDPLSVIHLK